MTHVGPLVREGLPGRQTLFFPLPTKIVAPSPLALNAIKLTIKSLIESNATGQVTATIGVQDFASSKIVSSVSAFHHF